MTDSRPMRLVMIEWVDSFGCSSAWTSMADCEPEPMVCRSVGWLLHDGDQCKVLVPHVSDQAGQGCGDMTIPVGAISMVTEITLPGDIEQRNLQETNGLPLKPNSPDCGKRMRS